MKTLLRSAELHLLTGTCLPAGDDELMCPRSLPTTPWSWDHSSRAWPAPRSAFSGSSSSPQTCRFWGMSKRCTWLLAERSCYWGSVQPLWVFYSRADLVIKRVWAPGNVIIWRIQFPASCTPWPLWPLWPKHLTEIQTLEKEQLIYSMYNFVTRKKATHKQDTHRKSVICLFWWSPGLN